MHVNLITMMASLAYTYFKTHKIEHLTMCSLLHTTIPPKGIRKKYDQKNLKNYWQQVRKRVLVTIY